MGAPDRPPIRFPRMTLRSRDLIRRAPSWTASATLVVTPPPFRAGYRCLLGRSRFMARRVLGGRSRGPAARSVGTLAGAPRRDGKPARRDGGVPHRELGPVSRGISNVHQVRYLPPSRPSPPSRIGG